MTRAAQIEAIAARIRRIGVPCPVCGSPMQLVDMSFDYGPSHCGAGGTHRREPELVCDNEDCEGRNDGNGASGTRDGGVPAVRG